MSPEETIKSIDIQKVSDPKLLHAVIAYHHASALASSKETSNHEQLILSGNQVTRCMNRLLDVVGNHELENGNYLKVVNLLPVSADITHLMNLHQLDKSIGDTFKYLAASIIRENSRLTLSRLEVLVNARKYNKRLPKELSACIKGILDGNVHSKSQYWKEFQELSTLQGLLRKLWIQCMSLQLYNYIPDESYTIKLISEIVPSVLQSDNAEVQYLFCRIMHDAEIKSVAVSNYDQILSRLINQKKDQTSLLLLHAALHLNKKIKANTSWINKIGTGQPIEFPTSTEDSRLKTEDSKPYDLKSVIKHHPTWAQHAVDFVRLQAKGMTMKEFCQKNNLSEPAFSEFYSAVIKDIEKDIQQDPFLSKLASLPHKVQDEYSELMSRKKDVLERVCEAVSGITGEKVEIKDILNAADNKNARLDKKMKKALDNLASVNPIHALKFMTSSTELKRIEAEIDAFLTKHHL